MPSKSPAQHRFMEAIAHNPEFARKANVPQSVGREFVAHDANMPAKSMQAIAHIAKHRKK